MVSIITVYGNGDGFEVVGMHQVSALSFAICDCHGSFI